MCRTQLPWVICEDFNAIFALKDKNYGNPNLGGIQDAQGFFYENYDFTNNLFLAVNTP